MNHPQQKITKEAKIFRCSSLVTCHLSLAAACFLLLSVSAATAQISSQIPDSGGGNTIEPAPISPPGDGNVLPGPTPISDGTPPITTLATNVNWTGTTSTDWSLSTNWSSGVPSSSDIARFTDTFSNQPNLTSSASVGALWMTGTLGQNVTLSASSGSLTINGTTITGNGTTIFGILADNSDTKTLTISAPIILGGDQTWRDSIVSVGATTVTISGTVDTNSKALTVDGTGTTEVSGNISGSGSITKSGSGELILSGANSYSGGTTLSDGLLQLKTSSALGSSSGSLTVNGGILDLNGQNISVGNLTGTSGKIWNTGPLAGTGTVTLTIGAGNAGGGNYAGVIQDNNPTSNAGKVALTKTGTGTITLSGANTYSGATTIDGGTLLINGSIAAGSAVTVNNTGTLGGTGTVSGGVTINSGGTLMGGTGASTSDKLTVTGAVSLLSGSVVQLALGAAGAHSTLAIGSTGSISFALSQEFHFVDLGAQATTYSGIITGVPTAPLTIGTWTIDNPGWTGSFLWNATTDSIDLTLIAVPEPGTWIAGGLAFAALLISQRRRLKKLAVRS